jgi:hypothetical protein
MPTRIAFVVGTSEAANILNLPPGSPHFLVMSGGNAAALTARLENAIIAGANHVLCFDVSGSLTASLVAGALVVGTFVDGVSVTPVHFDSSWTMRIAASTGARPVHFACSSTTLWTSAEKEVFAEEFPNALAVDLESGPALLVANKHGLPCAALRAISDGFRQTLGTASEAAMNTDGSANRIGAIEAVVTDPSGLPDLLALGSTSSVAFNALSRAISDMGSAFCADR